MAYLKKYSLSSERAQAMPLRNIRKENIFSRLLTIAIFILGISLPSQAQTLSTDPNFHNPFVNSYIQMFNEASQQLDQNISNKENFKQQLSAYKENMENMLQAMLDDASQIIKKFSESTKEMLDSSKEVIQDFTAYTNDLWAKIMQYPVFAEVSNIVQPVLDKWIASVKSKLPAPHSQTATNNPLGKAVNFYTDMSAQNPDGLGPLFETEPVVETDAKDLTEKTQEKTFYGFKTIDVLSKETNKYVNNELTFHQIVLNNQTVENFAKPRDFSIYHGALDQMKKDGANPHIIAVIQEQINYINFLLARAHQQDGLIFDTDNPQLVIPPGYDEPTFVHNFTDDLNQLANEVQ